MRPLLLAGLLLALTPAAGTETVYRCPGEGGVTFTDEPCPGGERLQLPAGPAAGAAAAARERAEALAESAETLAEARRERAAERRAEAARRAPPAPRGEPAYEPRWVGYGYPPHHLFPHKHWKRGHHPPRHGKPPREPAEERVIGRTDAFQD